MMAGIQKEVKVIFNVFFKKTIPMPKEPLLLFQVQNRHISALCKIWSVEFFLTFYLIAVIQERVKVILWLFFFRKISITAQV